MGLFGIVFVETFVHVQHKSGRAAGFQLQSYIAPGLKYFALHQPACSPEAAMTGNYGFFYRRCTIPHPARAACITLITSYPHQ